MLLPEGVESGAELTLEDPDTVWELLVPEVVESGAELTLEDPDTVWELRVVEAGAELTLEDPDTVWELLVSEGVEASAKLVPQHLQALQHHSHRVPAVGSHHHAPTPTGHLHR